jgi:hypothetical protein
MTNVKHLGFYYVEAIVYKKMNKKYYSLAFFSKKYTFAA